LLSAQRQLQQLNAVLEQEIAERLRVQEKLLQVALNNPLTGLPNRTLLVQRLQEVLNRAQQRSEFLFVLLLLDCDWFKVINNSLGHPVGDQLLAATARRLESHLRPGNTLARLGGDEFAILLNDIASLDQAIHISFRVRRRIKHSRKTMKT
jgi:diguanylate cyclase (GGDEF)-like protein